MTKKFPGYVVPLIVSVLFFRPVFAGEITDLQIVKGKCDAQSHISEGALGSDLTKRRSRFYCDSATIAFFDNVHRHIMVTFAESKSHTATQVGFSGLMESDGQILNVRNVYIGQKKFNVAEGHCKFFFKNKHMHSIACGAPIDQGQRRTVPIVTFKAAPSQ